VPKTPADQPFEIRRSRIQGRGAFATRRIRPGQRIAEYVGDRITPEEGDRRYQEDGMNRHHTFLFTLDEHTVIDGKRKGNDSRYINHSCDPNCEAIIEDDRIFVHAKKNIQPGTELTYDYQYERHEDHDESTERFYVCHCGSPKCRGTILKPEKKTRARSSAKKTAAKKAGSKTRSRTASR
jgi:SET domain-containing protein